MYIQLYMCTFTVHMYVHVLNDAAVNIFLTELERIKRHYQLFNYYLMIL